TYSTRLPRLSACQAPRPVVNCHLPVPAGFPLEEMRTGLLAAGSVRALGPDSLVDLESAAASPARDGRLTIVQDRLRLRTADHGRLVESLEQALRHGRGRAAVRLPDAGDRVERFSSALGCAACGFAVRD